MISSMSATWMVMSRMVAGQQHGHTALQVDVPDELAQALLRHHVHADGGLIQEHHLRVVQQRRRQVGLDALAQDQLADGPFEESAISSMST